MNTCKSLCPVSGKRPPLKKIKASPWGFIFLFFFTSFSLESQDNLKRQLIPHFACIESQDSDQKSVRKAIHSILAFGAPATPWVEEQFKQTQNPTYFYIIQKIKQGQPRVESWNKEDYFKTRYREASHLLQRGEEEKALEICRAILILEPGVSFEKELKRFIHQCNDALLAKKVIGGTIRSEGTYFYPLQPIEIRFSLKNHQDAPVVLMAKDSGIVVRITTTEYGVDGGQKEEILDQVIRLKGELEILPQREITYVLTVSNPELQGVRTVLISAHIPRCQIKKGDTWWYPRIQFNEINLVSFPKRFHQVVQSPLETALWSLKLGYADSLFFSSFFLGHADKCRLIEALIPALDDALFRNELIHGILRRLTQKKFSHKAEWQNWWEARGWAFRESAK